ncbi:hypothetical protein M885DRAFT_553323 [Pelagophyceae sp. CCMP2097]|nr:hypothetical protein M885DRAFT_553323 [Pelagophyceae sp. CCMP2097]
MQPWSWESYKPTAKMLKAECEKRVPRTRCTNWLVPECITFLKKNTAVVALNAGGGVLDARGLRRLSREERREDFDAEADENVAAPKDGLRLLACIDYTREAFALRGTKWDRAQKDDKELHGDLAHRRGGAHRRYDGKIISVWYIMGVMRLLKLEVEVEQEPHWNHHTISFGSQVRIWSAAKKAKKEIAQ